MKGSTRRSRLLFLVASAVLAANCAWSADDMKVIQLEDDVRNLQREVQLQSRRIDLLENALRQALAKTTGPVGRDSVKIVDSTQPWLEQTNWDKLRIGMSEADALRILGAPNSTRADDKSRTLFYAMELEAGGFLSGQVVVSEQKVVEIRKPVLK